MHYKAYLYPLHMWIRRLAEVDEPLIQSIQERSSGLRDRIGEGFGHCDSWPADV